MKTPRLVYAHYICYLKGSELMYSLKSPQKRNLGLEKVRLWFLGKLQKTPPVIDSVDLDSLRIQMMGESNLSLVEEQGELYGISGESGKGKDEEEKILLSDIIQRINEVFGENLGEEDRVTLEQIQQRMNTHDELKKVVIGNNSDDVKKEYFNNLFKDTVIDFHGDRQEFYKNVMNKNIYPMMVDFMFKEYMNQLGK